MDEKIVVDRVIEEVAEAVPHITSGMRNRREYTGDSNPSDEEQIEADIWANEFLKELITSIDGVGQFASEEEEDVTDCGDGFSVTIDPLDGSSNIPTNNLVGIIVGIYDAELPCSGRNMVAAFYVVLGPLTTFTVARNGEVREFVLEEKDGDRVELHDAGKLEFSSAKVYGFGGREDDWPEWFREYAEEVREELKLRYGGAFVGDFNQVMHRGGVFAYPELKSSVEGKYRLLFEANPMAFIAEVAGGAASDGREPILEVDATSVHQRTPFYSGSEEYVERLERSASNC